MILYTILSLSALGVLFAIILYFVAQKFKVIEDPKIDATDEALPGANCGGCGFPGCRPFAEACVKEDNLDDLFCPVGGNEVMKDIALITGKKVEEKAPEVAVVRCNGTSKHRKTHNDYDGVSNCSIASSLYAGETDCSFGCLGLGDCEVSCDFDALYINPISKLPEVIDDKCTACGACVKACPKDIIELRKKNKKDRKIFVSCVNEDKGAAAKRSCAVACIGCQKCLKVCNFDAIEINNFLAIIDSKKCKLCRKCVQECPTGAILEVNMPVKKVEKEMKKEL